MKRRILSAFLSIALLVGLLPVGALAATGVEQHTDHTDWTAIAAEGGQLQTGNYYLSDDVKLTTDLTIPAGAEVTLCLNGHVLTGTGSGPVITLNGGSNAGATFNLCDCNDSSTHYYTVDDATGLWSISEEKTANTITGGVITGGRCDGSSGGGVYATTYYNAHRNKFNMYGGTIAGNSNYQGGGVCLDYYSNFTMYDGAISGNASLNNYGQCYGGGVYVYNDSTFTMSGGVISENRATGSYGNGGGVCVNSGTFNLSGSGQITGNHADGMGGGIFCQSSVVSMSGGTITDNTAEVGTGTDCAGLSGENGSFTFSGGNLGGEINQLANPVVSVTGGRMDRDAYTSLKGNLESGKAAAYLTASDGGTNYDAEYPYGVVDENKIVATANHNGVEVNFISLASAADYAALYGNEVSFTAGDFTISGGVLGTDFSYADGVLTILTNKELTISNTDSSTSTTDRIVVNSGATATLILNNVDITGNSTTSGPQSAIDLSAGATLTLILEDGTSNTLVGAAGGAYDGAPCIHVPEGATLIIQGSGSLTVTGGSSQTGYTGNGIGGWHDSTGGSNNEACGTVIILAGGNININAGSGGSGDGKDIGGGFGNSGLSASDGSGIRPSSNDNNTYTVYGDLTLPTDVTTYTIPQGVTVNVPGGTSLTIPEGVELVVNGTLNVAGALTNNGTLSGDGTLKGSGTFTDNGTNSIKNNAFTTNISVSTSGNAVVGGTVTLTATVTNGLNENITSGSVTSYRGGASSGNEINTNAASVSNGSATYTINSLDWTPSETAYTITAVYTPATGSSQQSASGTTSLTVGQGQPSITAVAYKGENQTNEFTYGDTITIEGTVSVSSPVSANSLTANQVGLYLGENQLGNAVTVGSGGSFTLTYDTGDKGIPIGDYQTLTIKYGGSGNLTTGEATVTITLNKKQVSALVQGDITKTWDGDDDAAVSLSVSADDLVAGDSLTVTAPNTAYASTGVSDSIVIDFGTLTVAGAAADFYTVNAPTGVTGSITPAGASVGTAPAAVENLVYADSAQDLVSGGAASGGNLVYALGAETEATETYSQTVPQESNAGTYYVWYYVQGDSNHNDSDPACVTVSIAKKDISGANITLGTALIYNGDQQTQTITSVTVDGLTLTAGDYTIRSNTGTNVESYTLTVTGTGNFTGTAEQTWSIGKATQTPPTASTQTVTASSVTLNTVDAGQGETQYGYVIGANGAAESVANWGTNNSFSGLKAAAAYTFFVRYAGDSNHHAAVSSGLTLYTAHATPTGTEGYTIDYLNEQVSAAEGYEVKVGDGEWTSASTQITPGGSFQVRQAATANGAPESAANTVDVEARPDQPTGLTGSNETVAGRHDGSISGVADTMEYRRDDSDGWTGCTGNTITGLAPGTYLVRLKAVSGASFAGAEATVVIATGAERTYTLNVTAPTFAGVYTGYTQPAAQPLTITSTGNSDAAITSVTLTGDTSAFALNKTDGAAITAGSMDNTTYMIRPAAGLARGTYTATVTVAYNDGATATAQVSFTVSRRSSSSTTTPSRPSTTEPSTGSSGGWEEIGTEIAEAQPGDTIVVDMNGTTEVPAEVFEEVAGKDVTVEFDLGGGLSWTVNGQDVPTGTRFSSLNLGVDMGTSGISVNVINNITGEYGSVQVTLAHDGEFGFTLTLTAPLGSDNAGHWANLYYYHEDSEELTFQTSGRIGADGSVSLRFTHASQYAIVIDDHSHELPFEDVPEGAWYYDAAVYVYSNGLMAGTSGTTFSPDTTTSRAMIATILYRLAGSPDISEEILGYPFSDVDAESWYGTAVYWARLAGVVGGYPDGSFGPNDPITREQMAAMLYRYAQYQGIDAVTLEENLSRFTDADKISGYAVQAMNWAVGHGIIGGYGNGTLRPQGEARRSEAAAMLMRFCENLTK